ncbi:hypothetical protein ACHAXS_004316 [Conticribra weissflogii]
MYLTNSPRRISIDSIAPRSEKSIKKSSRHHSFSNVTLSLLLLLHTKSCSARSTPEAFFVAQTRRQFTSIDWQYKRTEIYSLEQRTASLPFPSTFVKTANNIVRNSKTKKTNNHYTEYIKDNVLVGMESTSPNSRRISGEMLMDIPIDDVWSILTDYDNLATHVPNLVESRVIDSSKPRVYQRGAQKIFGFKFGADVTMDMTEQIHRGHDQDLKKFSVDFKCVDSQFFSNFDGSWIVEECANDLSMPGSNSSLPLSNAITMVQYIVDVRPKGPVPVAALEWRIKEDVPTNIMAVCNSARSRMLSRETLEKQSNQRQHEFFDVNRQNRVFKTQQELSPRRTSPLRHLMPRALPLRQVTSQATNFLKQTADSHLPLPASNIAKQVLNILEGASKLGSRRQNVSVSSRFDTDDSIDGYEPPRKIASAPKNESLDVEWYEDETMAMYLK